jgi:hypothetical protein
MSNSTQVPQSSEIPKQEFEDGDYGIRHRLVLGNQHTAWAGYTQFTYMKGYVGFTAYYNLKEGVLSSDEFVKLNGVM